MFTDDGDFAVEPPRQVAKPPPPRASDDTAPRAQVNRQRMGTLKENKLKTGAHGKSKVPDRMRDSFAFFGADGGFTPDDVAYQPKPQRESMLRGIVNDRKNIKSVASLDKVRIALDAASRKEADGQEWRFVQTLLRTNEFCVELVQHPTDEFPEADKLYIALDECEVPRQPYLYQLPDGTIVMPVFSYEEYVGHYFQRLNIFESQWFPLPRMGTCFESFKKEQFPVVAHGSLKQLASLATVATPHQLVMLINPGQENSKFLTYPELLDVAGEKGAELKHHHALRRLFDTRKWDGRRLGPTEMEPPKPDAPDHVAVPHIARDELRLLMFDLLALQAVFLYSADGVRHVVVVLDTATAEDEVDVVLERLGRWSYLEESEEPLEVRCDPASAVPAAHTWTKVYDGANVELLRSSVVAEKPTLREALGYDAPL